ncbi:MAG: hypothetical protein NPIRA05_18220 [Nitrospirales bacterium]|nr:MAG: hypothetical protein NPIRA05_18220 [Nitrospirales bacterium]
MAEFKQFYQRIHGKRGATSDYFDIYYLWCRHGADGLLSVVRMLPIFLSLSGLALNVYEKIFLGWFGLRGLASIRFALLIVMRFLVSGSEEILACVDADGDAECRPPWCDGEADVGAI